MIINPELNRRREEEQAAYSLGVSVEELGRLTRIGDTGGTPRAYFYVVTRYLPEGGRQIWVLRWEENDDTPTAEGCVEVRG